MKHLREYEGYSDDELKDLLGDIESVGHKHRLIPGEDFGFGKTIQDNFTIIKDLRKLQVIGLPILVGVSRKSSIYKTLGISADEALNGTTVVHTIAIKNGASILRVHDVKEAKQALILMEYLQ